MSAVELGMTSKYLSCSWSSQKESKQKIVQIFLMDKILIDAICSCAFEWHLFWVTHENKGGVTIIQPHEKAKDFSTRSSIALLLIPLR